MAYVDGFVMVVPKDRMEDYEALARLGAEIWMEHGAIGYVEAKADDVPYGERTSFPRAVQATEDETVVFAWILYPSREVRDAVNAKVMADERMPKDMAAMPFDGQRMIYGGFETIVQV
jgi:uncharacterized protein YbaA (DUF1428 family)